MCRLQTQPVRCHLHAAPARRRRGRALRRCPLPSGPARACDRGTSHPGQLETARFCNFAELSNVGVRTGRKNRCCRKASGGAHSSRSCRPSDKVATARVSPAGSVRATPGNCRNARRILPTCHCAKHTPGCRCHRQSRSRAEFRRQRVPLRPPAVRRQRPKVGASVDALGHPSAGRRAAYVADAFQDLLLGTGAKALYRRDSALTRGTFEVLQRLDAELFVQCADAAGTEAGDTQQFEHAVRRALAQIVVVARTTGRRYRAPRWRLRARCLRPVEVLQRA